MLRVVKLTLMLLVLCVTQQCEQSKKKLPRRIISEIVF